MTRQWVAALLLMVAGIHGARADDYPSRTVTMIVPFPAGGRTDVIGRVVAQHLSKQLGKSVAVVNKPGASSVRARMSNNAVEPSVTSTFSAPTPCSVASAVRSSLTSFSG